MSEKRKRNSYSPEFKAKVGLEAIHGVKTVNEIGQAYGVHPVQVGQWKKATLAALPDLADRLWASWLQSTTPRTAGFNSLDIASLTQGTSLVLMLLMFVGAGANGTGSGIKVTTLFVLLAATWTYIRRRRVPTLFSQVIDTTTLIKALAVTVMAVLGIFMGTLALSISEGADLLTVAFEATSALGTVGLSHGLTPELSGWGQMIIMTMMFIGRVCPLTVAHLVGSAFGASQKSELQIG